MGCNFPHSLKKIKVQRSSKVYQRLKTNSMLTILNKFLLSILRQFLRIMESFYLPASIGPPVPYNEKSIAERWKQTSD